jgi:hypothetical protein
MCPARNIFDNANAKTGVHAKFIVSADSEKRKFMNDFDSNFMSIDKNTKNNINIRNISINRPAFCSMNGQNFPIITPKKAETMINTGCIFAKTLTSSPHPTENMS